MFASYKEAIYHLNEASNDAVTKDNLLDLEEKIERKANMADIMRIEDSLQYDYLRTDKSEAKFDKMRD